MVDDLNAMDLGQIRSRLEVLLTDAERWLPPNEVASLIRTVRAGEPGVALEDFCTQLEEYAIRIPPEMAAELRALATAMRMRVPSWIEGPIA